MRTSATADVRWPAIGRSRRPSLKSFERAGRPWRGRPALLELIGDLLNSGLCARLFLRLSADRAAEADAADRFAAGIDRHPATERDHIREHPLSRIPGLGVLRPLRRGLAERARRIGLAAGKLDIMRIGVVALEEDTQSAGAVDDGYRGLRA